jgi:hypothetical protein
MINERGVFTRILAVAGTVLTWFPIAAPILLTLARLGADGRFRFDYLIPAELFPSALVGGLLLFWAAIRSRSHLKLIGWSFGSAIVLLIGSQVLAMVTGLASGAIDARGWVFVVVLGGIIAYALGVVAMAVGGVLLLRDLNKPAMAGKAPQ